MFGDGLQPPVPAVDGPLRADTLVRAEILRGALTVRRPRVGCTATQTQVSTGQHRSAQVRTGQHRSAQGSTGQDRSAQVRTGQNRAAQGSTGQDRAAQVRTGQHRSGQGRAERGYAFHPFS